MKQMIIKLIIQLVLLLILKGLSKDDAIYKVSDRLNIDPNFIRKFFK